MKFNMKFKLSKLNLFLIIIVTLVLSTLGFTIKEHYDNLSPGEQSVENSKDKRSYEQKRLAALAHGDKYDPFDNKGTESNKGTDPFLDNDYSKTIAGLEDDILPNRSSKDLATAKGAGIDLSKYILKSEVVPPVCPKCPDSRSCPRQKPCPPCPPPARCPESAFECKKVPSHNAMNVGGRGPGGTGDVEGGFSDGSGNGGYRGAGNSSGDLPIPQLNSFAQFN